MAVIDLRGSTQGVPAQAAQLAQALGQALFPGTVRKMGVQDMLLQNPELGQRLGAVARSAGGLEGMGIDPQMAAEIERMFPATLEEKVGRALVSSPDLVQNLVEAETIKPKADVAQAEQTIAESGLQREFIAQNLKHNIPLLQAASQAGELKFARELTTAQLEAGLPTAQAMAERMGADASTEQGRMMIEQLGEYREFMKQVSPHLRGAAIAAYVNPGLAQHILAHEQMDFQERLSRLTMAAAEGNQELSVIEQQKLMLDLRGEIRASMDAVENAESEDARRAAVESLEALAGWHRSLVGTGILPPGAVITAEMKKRLARSDAAEFLTEVPDLEGQLIEAVDQIGLDRVQFNADGSPNPAWLLVDPEIQARVIQHYMQSGRGPLHEDEMRFDVSGQPRPTGFGGPPLSEQAPNRGQLAAEIARLEAIPEDQRTPRQKEQLLELKGQISGTTVFGRGGR